MENVNDIFEGHLKSSENLGHSFTLYLRCKKMGCQFPLIWVNDFIVHLLNEGEVFLENSLKYSSWWLNHPSEKY